MGEQVINNLNEPSVVPNTPDETVIEQAMNLISALGAPENTKQLLSDLEVAVKENLELVETATDLKSEIETREIELSKHETDLCEREDVVKVQTSLSLELTTSANFLKTDLEHRENVFTKRQDDFNEKRKDAVFYIDGLLKNLDEIRKGLIDD